MKSVVFFSILWSIISFYLYWPYFFSILKKNKPRSILSFRIFGAILFGGVPVIFLLFIDAEMIDVLGLKIPSGPPLWHIVSLILVVLCFIVSYFQTRNPDSQKNYPQIREKQWGIKLIVLNSLTWMIYLVGYEMLFRGILLFPLVDEFGLEIALVVNIAIYSLSHASKDMKEGLGTIPIGLILFFIAWKTDSILYPIVIHWFMALTNSFYSVMHNPEMRFLNKAQ